MKKLLHHSRKRPAYAWELLTVYCLLTCLLLTATSFASVTNVSSGGAIYLTLSNAVFASSPGDTLLVSTGIYYETIDVYNRDLVIDGRYNEDFSAKVPGGKSIISAPRPLLTYSGSAFDVTNSTLTLVNIEVTHGGFAFGDNGFGGGLNLYYSDVMLYGCSVYDNFARGDGGGIYVYDSTLYATNTPIFDNRAHYGVIIIGENGCGGGVYANKSSIDLRNGSYVYSNTAVNTGGGIRIKNSEAVLFNIFIYNNHADIGGGTAADSSIYNHLAFCPLFANLANSKGGGILLENNSTGTISGAGAYIGFAPPYGPNVVTNGDGGGIYVSDSILTMSNLAAVAHNSATFRGGGIFLTNASLIVENEAYIGAPNFQFTNSAYQGGGIYAMDSTLNITNSTVTHGYAINAGGLFLSDCSAKIDDSEVNENWALSGYGGGILFIGSNIFYASQSSFNHNEAYYGGGVALSTESGDVNFESCSIISNRAWSAGGLFSIFGSSVNISGYSAISHNIARAYGGGIGAAFSGQLHLNGDSFAPLAIQGNTATNHGGGIYGEEGWNVEVKGNVLIGNNIALQSGGGIYLIDRCSLFMTNIPPMAPRVFANTAGESGGGIYIAGSNTIANLNNTGFGGPGMGNVCNAQNGGIDGGGGLAIRESAKVDALNCQFHENYSSNSGGGIYLGTNAILNMTTGNQSPQTTFLYGNSAKNAGGGIYSKLAKSLLVERTIIISNKTQNGGAGGIYVGETSNKLVNLLIAQNDGGFASGADGIFFFNCPKSEMLQCTIADNDRVGVKNNFAGTVYMTNCIVYGHSLSQIWAKSEINAVYSDIENGYPGVGNIDDDPLFFDPATYYYILGWNSPCINTGTNLPSVTNDIWGITRPQGGAWDMGAFENFARIIVSKSVLDFDELVTGESSNLVLTVKNNGTAYFEGSVSNLMNPPFSDNGFGTYSFVPGDQTNITFTFAPVVVGFFTNEITCTGGGNINVKLIGTAVPEPGYYLLIVIYQLLFISRSRKLKS